VTLAQPTTAPLTGVHVLDCAESLAAAFCTATLERMGATVYRVEVIAVSERMQPAFLDTYLSNSELYREYVHRTALRRRIDVDQTDGAEALTGLIQGADVVVEDRREPLLTYLGVDGRRCDDERPPPILVSITPNGRSGTRREDFASDLTIFHGAGPGHGVPGLVADPATMSPLRLGSHQGCFVSGLVAAINVCAAVLARARTRAPITVDVNCYEALANSFRQSLGTFAYYGGGTNRDLVRGRGAGGTVEHRNLRCRDGYINMAWAGVQQWDSLKGALGNPEWMDASHLANPALRYRNWAVIIPKLEEWTSEFDKEYLVYLCQGWRIPCAPVNDGVDLLEDEGLRSRDFWASGWLAPRSATEPTET
jgi:crotonobetainyl-CoA:carnitine CoA-transferase CaiB-like acyl-CoA transferase